MKTSLARRRSRYERKLPVSLPCGWGWRPRPTCNMCNFEHFFSKHNNSLSNERFRQSKLANLPPQAMKHLWIRTALMEKLLDKIVLYLVENSRFILHYLVSRMKEDVG